MTGFEPAAARSNEVTVACAPDTHHELRLPRSSRRRLWILWKRSSRCHRTGRCVTL
ncbi:hypothetical protein SNL152K_7741 [Streptomyces sp. NL15-2K]|nr:hypothetical protein SNL152K_7741 [Streptomyces sp. NL15-2K]